VSKIQKRYPSLPRELDLAAPGISAFNLLEEVRPVVVLHEHCEGHGFASASSTIGAFGPGNLAQVGPFTQGAYQVFAFVQVALAVPLVGAAKNITVELTDVNGVVQNLLAVVVFGPTGMNGLNLPFLFPKVHLDEQTFVRVRMNGAFLADDQSAGGLYVQPL